MIKYNFAENKLPNTFAQDKVKALKELIQKEDAITILTMPGTGVSSFLRYFVSAMEKEAKIAFIDIYDLVNLTSQEYLRQILKNLAEDNLPINESEIIDAIKSRLTEITTNNDQKVIIICNRFDQMIEKIDRNFLSQIYQLAKSVPSRVTFVFTANVPLYELCPNAISSYNLGFFSVIYYFGRYDQQDLKELLTLRFPNYDHKKLDQAVKLGNGHYQLSGMIYKSESIENPLLDHVVRLSLSEIYKTLNFHRKNIIQKIALGKNVQEIDPYLTNIGMVNNYENDQKLFTPLLSDFIQKYVAFKLPIKERKLFSILLKHESEVVNKEELFNYIWQEKSEDATDWALNALVYRLRKNPQLKTSGYEIVSQKKQGYMLVKI